jgi:hypothetical protein
VLAKVAIMASVIVDDLSAIVTGMFKGSTIVGTTFIPLNVKNANYSVPAATRAHIYCLDKNNNNIITNGPPTLLQLGYADDVIGTNFVLLYDLLLVLQKYMINAGAVFRYTAFLGDLVVPATKFPLIKVTDTVTTDTITLPFIIVQTG